MLPGPSVIVSCPYCGAGHRYDNYRPYDTFYATAWSDGCIYGPDLPHSPKVIRCATCQTFFWSAGAASEEVSYDAVLAAFTKNCSDCDEPQDLGRMKREWEELLIPQMGEEEGRQFVEGLMAEWTLWERLRRTSTVRELTVEECLEAIELGVATNRDQELTLRILAWHRYNDRGRTGERGTGRDDSGIWRPNAYALLNLLDSTDPEQRLMRAELYRELGDFERCRAELDELQDPTLRFRVDALRRWCDAGDTAVRVWRHP